MIPGNDKQTILVVDDTPENIEILRQTLRDEYKVRAALDGHKALQIAASEPPPDLILLDILMPGLDGYEVCRRLKAEARTAHIPVVFVTALDTSGDEAHGLELGAVDFVRKPFEPALVKARLHNQLELKRYRDHLEELVAERTRELALTRQVTIEAMGTLAEYRDPETGGHIKRTQGYVRLLAQCLSKHPRFSAYLQAATIDLLYLSAPLHDIGKVAVRDSILLKPGKLTKEEFEQMKRHVIYGCQAIEVAESKLGNNSFLRVAKEIAASHHEKWDGSGYPQGLAGDAIPIAGRLMAIADVYDALISKRVYKPPFPHARAIELIIEERGSHFDPDMVDAFVAAEDEFRKIALAHADHEEEKTLLSTH
jgi:putative two-component system response regulator